MKPEFLIHDHQTIKFGVFRPNCSRQKSTVIIIQSSLPKQDLKGQSVAVRYPCIGLGKSGVAAASLALARGASVIAIDQNENWGSVKENIRFKGQSNLKTVLGHFDTELLKNADISPGVPLENYGLSSLFQLAKRVMSELHFAAEVLPGCTKILAVSGTNGKSTVATLAGQVAVVEVSSYQLEIPKKYFSPSVAVVLNLTPDHLERHKTIRNYAVAKCRVFSQMRGNKIGILSLGNPHLNEAVAEHVNGFNLAWIGAFPGVEVLDMQESNGFEWLVEPT